MVHDKLTVAKGYIYIYSLALNVQSCINTLRYEKNTL
jgi:hypothetical protein